MRIGFVLSRYPERSQSFVYDQVQALVQRGHEVEVLAGRQGDAADHTAQAGMGLAHFEAWQLPDALGWRALGSVPRWLRLCAHEPRLALAAVDVRRYGWHAASGTLAWASSALVLGSGSSRFGSSDVGAARFQAAHFGLSDNGAKRRYDVILAHFGTAGALAAGLISLGLLQGPLCTFFHGFDLTSALRVAGPGLYQNLFAVGARFYAISEFGLQRLLHLGAPPARSKVLHLGVNLQQFARAVDTDRRQYAAGVPLRVVSVARLIEKKGITYALQAVAAARQQGLAVSYHVYGDGPLRASLQRQAAELGLSAVTHWHGAVAHEQVRAGLASADVVLAPSVTARDGDEEGIPVVLMEAMACEATVISSLHAGIRELVQDGVNGWLVAERDVQQLAARLLLAQDQALRQRLGGAARASVMQHFNQAEQIRRLEVELQQVQTETAE